VRSGTLHEDTTAVTPGNSGDAEAAVDLLPGDQDAAASGAGVDTSLAAAAGEGQPAVYGDSAYGSGDLIERHRGP
jgi:hypothetical protein